MNVRRIGIVGADRLPHRHAAMLPKRPMDTVKGGVKRVLAIVAGSSSISRKGPEVPLILLEPKSANRLSDVA